MQAGGAFDGERILERKPVGFPQDGGLLKPYSTIFYWAHAWSDTGGMIGEHPHQGFEIMSYVLRGAIEHYDSMHKGWKRLNAGDVQIIRAGSGITHAEKILPGAAMFQIWFDPDVSKTLSHKASYNDYPSELFPVYKDQDSSTKVILGGTPFMTESNIGDIREITFFTAFKEYPLSPGDVYSLFLIEGNMVLNGNKITTGDFALLEGESTMQLAEISAGSKVFVIRSPLDPGYNTYAGMRSI